MTAPRLTWQQIREGATAGLKSGRFKYLEFGARVKCTFCGRTGWRGGSWMEGCILGHPYVCACGRVFASKQGLATHRRHLPGHLPRA